MGLQTATWLIEGEALHRDSLGTEQLLAPGQLNLMTAGHGIAHSEEATNHFAGRLQGIQLWIALPGATRSGIPAFEHHAILPRVDFGDSHALLFMGALAGQVSPARHDTPLVGCELSAFGAVEIPLRPDFEHALIVLEGALRIDGVVLEPGHLGYLSTGRDQLDTDSLGPSRAILLGGEPFPEPIAMWWNFVGRTRQEFVEAYRSWADDDGRFGSVASPLPRIETTPPLPDRTTRGPPASL
jgi:redox-sensitive bicupin YhaK (pirin superfamily)